MTQFLNFHKEIIATMCIFTVLAVLPPYVNHKHGVAKSIAVISASSREVTK